MKPVVIGDATLYLGDCLEILPTIGPVDAVVTDPMYGISGSSGTINRLRAKGDYVGADDSPEKVRTVAVVAIKKCIETCGCVVLTPGTKNFSMYPQPDSFGCFYQPASVGLQVFGNGDAQPIFYYGRNQSGKNMGVPCSYQLTEAPEKNGHPCVKPITIWTKLVKNVSKRDATILDPFMGSGTTGVACVRTGRRFIGIEIERKYFDIAVKRIERAFEDQALFTHAEPSHEQAEMFGIADGDIIP
jgi:DNA modification methylase